MKISSYFLLIFSVCVFNSAIAQTVEPPYQQQLYFSEYVDYGTVSISGKRMHVCESGVMSGIHVKNDDQLCFSVTISGAVNPNKYSSTIDVNTNIDPYGTRICPTGYAMVGVHVKDNYIKCAPVFFENRSDYFIDTKNTTLRYGMHACPAGSYLIGWQKPYHNLICRTYQSIITLPW